MEDKNRYEVNTFCLIYLSSVKKNMYISELDDDDYDSDDTLTEEPVRKPTASKQLFKVLCQCILRNPCINYEFSIDK